MTIDQMPFMMIVGPSASGKSTSLRNLDRKTTEYINVEEKALPFPRDFKHHHHPMLIDGRETGEDIDPGRVLANFNDALAKAIKNPETELIVIDSFTKWDEIVLSHHRQTQRGYDIYNGHNENVKKILNRYKGCGKPMVWTAIDDVIRIETAEETDVLSRRVKVYGRELEGGIEKEFTLVLFTETVRQPNKTLKYFFRTNSDGLCSAKTPMGMFTEILVDNDLDAVLQRVWEYYEAQEDEEEKAKPKAKAKGKK